jgi:hypothetical protein
MRDLPPGLGAFGLESLKQFHDKTEALPCLAALFRSIILPANGRVGSCCAGFLIRWAEVVWNWCV